MHRHIVYPGSIPLDTDLLNAIKDAYYGDGWLAQAMIGVNTAVVGLAVTPTSPASLQVNVAPGAIYSFQTVDSTAYGSLGTDANQFVKQGILAAATTLTLTPPGTTGQSINYLVQVAFSETDGSPVVLPYYNASNPSVAWSGPNNTGVAQNTVRKDTCVVQMKPGSPASTGSQTTPAPDAGYTGLYVIAVANGATTITSGNITLLSTAPYFPSLPQIPSAIQTNQYTFTGTLSGSANAIIAALTPAPAALVAGLEISMKMAASPTGDVTINLNGLGAVAARDSRGIDFVGGEWAANDMITWKYNGTEWRAQHIGKRSYKYDLAAPPGADIALYVSDKLTLTFSNVASIPLYTATSEGLYAIKLLIFASNTADSNWLFKPNNTTYTNAFSYGVIEHTDAEITSFGSSTSNAGFADLTSSPNFIGALPRVDYKRLSRSSFFMDLFYGPAVSDTIQSRGPSMQELLVSTKTVAKMLKQSGQILASPSISASFWHDTTTAWASLGTLVDQGATSMSGLVIIERLA